mmetsp:Transcript_18360/g.42349  ORF Transcript_18360/g.42349 Transcript_18360/m.42349 type:complete len:537 (-) Transcript_18360:99-1709(-)
MANHMKQQRSENGEQRLSLHHNGGDVAPDVGSLSSTRARFRPDVFEGNSGEEEDGPFDFIVDFFFGALALWISIGLWMAVVLLCIFVSPFSKTVYRRLVDQIGTGSYLEAISLLLPNTQIYLTGDSDVPSPVGTSILVSNHIMDADWYSLLALGRCVGLRGSIKVFLRNEIFHLNKRFRNESTPPPKGSPSMRKSSSVVSAGTLADEKNQVALRNSGSSNGSNPIRHRPSSVMVLAAKFLHTFLEFPLIDEEGYVTDRASLFKLLRSFTECDGAAAPVHFLLFPEGWSLYNGEKRSTVLARSNDFAKREGRPQLKHLLLPRSTGFNASISSLRESSPVIYDVTVAYCGYNGDVPSQKGSLSLYSLWNALRRRYPQEIHIRIKRYSMEEVLQDASWLDKKWAEKDKLLQYFSRRGCFPTDSRGFRRHQLFETRFHSMETSIMSLLRLSFFPSVLPFLIFLSIPIIWTTFVAWLLYKGFLYVYDYPDTATTSRGRSSTNDETDENTGNSPRGTPFIPATPFASPSVSDWHDSFKIKSN